MKGRVSLGGFGLMALVIAVAGGCGDDSTDLGNIGGASVGTAGSSGTSTGGSGPGGDGTSGNSTGGGNTGGSNTGGGGSGPGGSSMGGGGSAPDGGAPDAAAPQDGSSSDAVNDSATNDAAASDGATSDGPPPACTAPTDPAPGITGTMVDAPMPNDAAGSMVYSGTYYRTQYLFYQGSSAAGDVRKQTLRVDVANINFYDEDVTSPYSGGWGYGTFTTNGSTLTLSTTCPVVAQLAVPYTATDTTLKLYETDKKRVQIFTKQ